MDMVCDRLSILSATDLVVLSGVVRSQFPGAVNTIYKYLLCKHVEITVRSAVM
jgi:hypothetical protein